MITLAGGGFLQAKLTAVPSGGIKTVSLVAGGSGYSATPQTLTLVQSGAASGTVTCTITGGVVTAITAVSAVGTGYSVASTLATTGGGGTNCTITINEIYQPSFICNYIDTNDIPGVTTGYLNGTTAVTILESPPTGQRMLDLGIIFNADKATVTPIIELVSGGNTVEIHPRQSLAINQTLQFGRQTEGVLDIDDYLLITDIDDTPIDGATDTAISSNWAYDHVAAADPHTGYVLETLFDAYTMLYADTNNTPAIVTLAASQIPGRKSTGGIVALAKSDLQTIINVADGATANDMAAPGAIGGTTPAAITGTTITVNTICQPDAVDGAGLGDATHQWSDLFLAEGGVINWDNGDATLTQVGDVVTLAGADLKVTTPGNAATSVVTTDGTQTLTNKTLAANSVLYTMLDKFALSRYINQGIRRLVWHQFDSYDMITESLGATGTTNKAYLSPAVHSATTNDTAALYMSSNLLNQIGAATYTTLFQTGMAFLNIDTVDCEAFIGVAYNDNAVILSTTNDKNYVGFLFKVDGANKYIYAVNCDAGGTAGDITSSLIGSDVTATYSLWIYSVGTTIYFYRNGALVATHTTNIPSSYGAWKMTIKGLEAAAVYFTSRPFNYTDYLT